MAQQIVTNNSVRLYLMDRPEYNTLLDGVRFSEEMINQAVLMTVSYYNESNPPAPVVYSVETFPHLYTLLTGVSGYLLKSAAINEASNSLDYVADGVSIADKNHAEVFLKIGKALWDEYKELAFNQRTNSNLAACYGNASSEWRQRAFTV